MSIEPNLIEGEIFSDDRGSLTALNDFFMDSVVRFYHIYPKNTDIIRGWQAHKKEHKWFYCTNGGFEVKVVYIDDFNNPPNTPVIKSFILEKSKPKVLFVPGGHATAFKALVSGSGMQVFSNFNLTESVQDDYRFPLTKWTTQW